jgi:hypothetical protein
MSAKVPLIFLYMQLDVDLLYGETVHGSYTNPTNTSDGNSVIKGDIPYRY